MPTSMSPRLVLREATAADHERVDAAFGRFQLGGRDGYAAFLRAQAEAFLPVEAGIDEADPERILPDWPERRRAPLLHDDLADLGMAPGPLATAPRFDSREAILGAAYVLEGSRLGGRMLARSVPPGLPRRFIQADDAGRWRRLVAILDATLHADEQVAAAVDAARMVFARFEASAHRRTKVACP